MEMKKIEQELSFTSSHQIVEVFYKWDIFNFEDLLHRLVIKQNISTITSPDIYIHGKFLPKPFQFRINISIVSGSGRTAYPGFSLQRVDGGEKIDVKYSISFGKAKSIGGLYEQFGGTHTSAVESSGVYVKDVNFSLDGSYDVYLKMRVKFLSAKRKTDSEDTSNGMKPFEKCGTLADITLIGRNKTFPVHAIILAQRSEFFADYACPKKSSTKGKETGIKLDFEDAIIENFLNFIYTEDEKSLPRDLDSLLGLLSVSEKFIVNTLKQEVESILVIEFLTVPTVAALLSNALTQNAKKLENAARHLILDNISQICRTAEFVELMRVHPDALMSA